MFKKLRKMINVKNRKNNKTNKMNKEKIGAWRYKRVGNVKFDGKVKWRRNAERKIK